MPNRIITRPVAPRSLTQAEMDELCRTAARAWGLAPGSARKAWFRWRGTAFYATHTSFRILVHTPQGDRVAYVYD